MKRHLQIMIAMLLPVAGAIAQSTSHSAVKVQYAAQTPICDAFSFLVPGHASSSCPPTSVPGGSGSGSSSATFRSLTAAAQFTWDGSGVGAGSQVRAAGGAFNRNLHIVGYTGNSDFVFHIRFHQSAAFTNTVNNLSSVDWGLSLNLGLPFNYSSGSYFQTLLADGTMSSTLTGLTVTPYGVDWTAYAPYTTGTFGYDMQGAITERINDLQAAGSSVDAELAARVDAIEVVDRGTGVRQFFTMDDQGGGTYVGAITTPEPATLALVAPGIIGVLGLTRRRRRR